MEIKTYTHQEVTFKRLSRLARKRTFVMLVFFLAYNVVLAAIAISVFYTEVPFKRREQMVVDVMSLVSFERFRARPESTPALLEKLSIDLQPADLNLLLNSKAGALKSGNFHQPEKKSVPAVITYKNQSRKASLSLNLQPQELWTEADKWAIAVEVNDNDALAGRKQFFVFPPESRDYTTEWLFQQLLGHAGLWSRQNELVELALAGREPWVGILEEPLKQQLENDRKGRGTLLRFTGNTFRIHHFGEEALPAPFEALLAAFLRNEAGAQAIFDVDKLAVFFALNDLWGNCRSAVLETVDFYYDPGRSLLEPVFSAGRRPDVLEKSGILGAERLLGNGDRPKHGDRWLKPGSWYKIMFADPVFYQAYIGALEDLSNGEFLDSFLAKNQAAFRQLQQLLQEADPPLTADPIALLNQNKVFIRRTLIPYRQIYPFFNRKQTSDRALGLDIVNIHYLPVEILGAKTRDSISLTLAGPAVLLQAGSHYGPAGGQLVQFDLPEGISWADSMLTGLTITYRIPGSKRLVKEWVSPYSFAFEELSTGDLVRQKPNVASFDFLEIDEETRQIRVKPGRHRLASVLIIPKGYQVLAGEGVAIDLVNASNIVSYSPLIWTGSEALPISIFSSDSTGQGIAVIDAAGESSLRHVRFENLSAPDQNGWNPDGVITFYQSPAKVNNCQFKNNRKGATYLNFVRTDFAVDHSVFTNAHAGAFSSDFSNGKIRNAQFINAGRTALSVVGGRIDLEKVSVDKAGGTGISVGGKSRVEGRGLVIRAAEIAVTSKDLSETLLEDIRIEDSKIGYAAFQEKDEFGPSSIVVKENASLSGAREIDYLIEAGSSITVAGKAVGTPGDAIFLKEKIREIKNGKAN